METKIKPGFWPGVTYKLEGPKLEDNFHGIRNKRNCNASIQS